MFTNLILGKINKSSALSELVYSLSNLLVFYNDRIIEKANNRLVPEAESGTLTRRIKILLTTLEYCEVFIELSVHKTWGSRARWFVIVVVQTIKCIGRLILTLYCQNNKIVKNPPIPSLDRRNLNESLRSEIPTTTSSFLDQNQTVLLKRSGRALRKVDGAPPAIARDWQPLKHEPVLYPSQYAGKFIKTAELLYIVKPLVHLACMKRYGSMSWKSYLVPMAIDVASLRIYYKHREDLSKDQKQELSRRCVGMLLYLMRSPFYDRHSKEKIARLLQEYLAKQNVVQPNDKTLRTENLPPQQSNQQQQQREETQQQSSQQKRTRIENTASHQRPSTEAPKATQNLELESPPRKRNPALPQPQPSTQVPSTREGAHDGELNTDPNSIPPGEARATRSRSRIDIKQ
ncbi:peroxisomal membrane protein PEX16 [Uranotaenia lowii]|uniref:peroxisomal membrane protein PEX16 n=1 Tax=Uranotaenia lowii TaxID=190385 RepID=UPI002478A686|nr:peroxisomal membrane protein PEX16 [Uranotaenia lowii]